MERRVEGRNRVRPGCARRWSEMTGEQYIISIDFSQGSFISVGKELNPDCICLRNEWEARTASVSMDHFLF